jgi:outer membrane protein assembly factor BamB
LETFAMHRFALLLLVVVGCAPAPEVPKPTRTGTDWPTFGGPTADGSSPDKGIRTDWKDGLKKVWDCRMGDGYAPPVVADGRLIHFDRFDNDLVLTARHAETGKKLWEYKTRTEYEDFYGYDPGPRACPVIDGERVYAYGPDGQLFCVNATDGKEVWKLDTKKTYHVHQNFFGVGSVPLVVDDLLIVAVGGSPDGKRPNDLREAKGNGCGVVAFDKKTGKEKWKATDELASYSSPVLATFHDTKTVLYFARGGLIGLDPATGQERFSFKWRAKTMESVNAANPVVVGDTILLTECYEKGAVLLRVKKDFTLETVWSDDEADLREKALRGHWCTPVVDGKYVYGSSGRHEPEGDVRCVELATGAVKWTQARTRRSTLTKIDGHLITLTEDGTLYLIKPTAEKWDKVAEWNEKDNPDLRPPCWAPPVVARGLMYVRGKGKLCCYELMK